MLTDIMKGNMAYFLLSRFLKSGLYYFHDLLCIFFLISTRHFPKVLDSCSIFFPCNITNICPEYKLQNVFLLFTFIGMLYFPVLSAPRLVFKNYWPIGNFFKFKQLMYFGGNLKVKILLLFRDERIFLGWTRIFLNILGSWF